MPEKFRKSEWDFGAVDPKTCKSIIREFHYSNSSGKTGVLFGGLTHRLSGRIMGACIWNTPAFGSARWVSDRVGCHRTEVVSLSRLAIDDRVPRNAASFILSRSFKILRSKGYKAAVTFADPLHGHSGQVYSASGWVSAGRGGDAFNWTDPSGKMRSRKHGDGRPYNRAEMEAMGWTRQKSPGKFRFLYAIDRSLLTRVQAVSDSFRSAGGDLDPAAG